MREQLQDEDRLEYLAKVLHRFVTPTNAGQCRIEYDGVTCGGLCLAYDIITEVRARGYMYWSLRIIWVMAFIVVGTYLKTIVVNNTMDVMAVMDVMYGVGAFMGVFLGYLQCTRRRKGRVNKMLDWKRPDGTIYDPTVKQFPTAGACAEYEEFDGVCTCEECGKRFKEGDGQMAGPYPVCSTKCALRLAGL